MPGPSPIGFNKFGFEGFFPPSPPPPPPSAGLRGRLTRLTGLWPPFSEGVAVAAPYVPFEPTFEAFLTANVSVPAWHAVIPEKFTSYPAIAWQVVDADSGLNLAGRSGLGWKHVQVTVYSRKPGDCWTWAEAIRLALTGAPGKAALLSAHAHSERSGYADASDGSGKGTHSHMREYFIWFPEQKG